MSVDFNWDYPQPFQIDVTVEEKHIDVVGHVNNVIYLRWLEKIAWMHSHHLGLTWNVYQKENCAMVARRHELDYLAAAFKNDELVVGTWIIENNKKVSITRKYQIIRKSDPAMDYIVGYLSYVRAYKVDVICEPYFITFKKKTSPQF